jgi:hypothetical protein
VLADDPTDADARALLDRLQVDDPETEGEIDADVARAADEQSRALSLAASDGIPVSTPPMTSTTSPPFRWQSLLVGAAAVAMVSLAVVVARAVDNAVDVPRVVTEPQIPAVDDGQETSSGAPLSLAGSDEDAADADSGGIVSPVKPGEKPRRAKRAVLGLPVRPLIEVPPPSVSTTVVPRTSRRVTFRVKPWADIVVDGQVVAKNTLAHEAELSEGAHQVVFVNPRAKEHEVRFTVSLDGPPPLITARLEPRPALLVVRANVADAFVDVAGVGKSATDTLSRPLVVALDDQSTSEREVFVYKKDFRAYRKRHTFIAGETLQLDVVLEPDPGDAVSPPAPDR